MKAGPGHKGVPGESSRELGVFWLWEGWRGCPTTPLPFPCSMDLPHLTSPTDLPKHILDIWVIVLIILATILIMTALVLCPATAVIIYRVRTHPTRNGIV